MTTFSETDSSALLSSNTALRPIEPRIYSVLRDSEVASPYDSVFGTIYDRVACNPVYNRLIWGYPIASLSSLAREALASSKRGPVLDLACGSLAFTAQEYIRHSDRPVVLLDRSLKMLRLAKARLIKLAGHVPGNIVFLHADALQLPFRESTFTTIISQNLLHCLDDTTKLMARLKDILSDGGRIYFTTLVKGKRLADRYLHALANSGKLVFRSIEDHQAAFHMAGMPVKYSIKGNMAFIYYGG